jgi:putative salt-induced outer membrane protein YdiY
MTSLARLLALTLFASLLFADTVTLNNGDRITGKVMKMDGNAVVFMTPYAGEVKITLAAIAALTTDSPINVALKSGQTVRGNVALSNGQLRVDNGAPASMADVAALRDDTAQKDWQREDERLHHARLLDFWAGALTFGLSQAAGNSTSTTLTTGAAATRAAGKDKLALYFNQVYATQSTTLPYGETANRVGAGVSLSRDLASKLYVFGTNDYDYDKFLGLDLRGVFGGGFGYHAWKGPSGYLDIGGGADYNHEKYDTGLAHNTAEVLVNQALLLKLLAKVKLQERAALYPNISDSGQFRFEFDATASMPIYKFLEYDFAFSDRYQSNPLPMHKDNDRLFSIGIRWTFDQTKH